jgi:hypothetical protein
MTFLTNCNIDNKLVGKYGSSDNIDESRINNLYLVSYIPNKLRFRLFDYSVVDVDTAWAEKRWIYDKNQKPIIPDSVVGFNFVLPFSKWDNINNYRFCFRTLDTLNDPYCLMQGSKWESWPKILNDTIKILIQQRNRDTTIGWKQPIISDTLIFIKK